MISCVVIQAMLRNMLAPGGFLLEDSQKREVVEVDWGVEVGVIKRSYSEGPMMIEVGLKITFKTSSLIERTLNAREKDVYKQILERKRSLMTTELEEAGM